MLVTAAVETNTRCKSGSELRAKTGDSKHDLGDVITPEGSCEHVIEFPVKKVSWKQTVGSPD